MHNARTVPSFVTTGDTVSTLFLVELAQASPAFTDKIKIKKEHLYLLQSEQRYKLFNSGFLQFSECVSD